PATLRGLSMEEKVPYVLRIIGETTMSIRMRASLLEVEQSIYTWPQLATAVAHGGAAAADVTRRICLGQMRQSGRFFVELETLIPNAAGQKQPAEADTQAPPLMHNPRPVENGRASRTAAGAAAMHAHAARPGHAHASEAPAPEMIRRLVADAILAPSGGNAQPWRWLWDGAALDLYLDPAHVTPMTDFEGSGATVALGAATENLLLSARHHGLAVRLDTFPDAAVPHLAARFRFSAAPDADTEPVWRADLYPLLRLRHTNRRLCARQPLTGDQLAALTDAAQSLPGAGMQWLCDHAQLRECGELIGAGDRLRLLSQALHAELQSELRWTPEEEQATHDGIGVGTLELAASDLAGLRMCRDWPTLELVRQWGGGRNLEKMSRKAVDAAAAVGLLTMPAARAVDYFHGGRVVERLWLTAMEQGLAFHPMTTLPYLFARLLRGGGAGLDGQTQIELRELRRRYEQLFRLAGSEAEVMLFRVSLADETQARSLRRPLEETLTFA
ncbi:MAG: hypothetical protein ACKV2V_14360, partial [Blastocatellia bacterium]